MATITALQKPGTAGTLDGYDPGHFYCELMGSPESQNRNLAALWQRLQGVELGKLRERAGDAERELFTLGITFTVYSERSAIDRILPFDVIPRVITATDWRKLDRGIKQRIKTLNLFLWDVYHEQKILKDGILPPELVLGNSNFRPEMIGYDPPCSTYIHIAGTDIIRDPKGTFYVLEDNARTPSGVSYVVENRHLMQRAFPDLMQGFAIQGVSEYGEQLSNKLIEVAPSGVSDPNIVLLSPGVFNSAYFEHVFLAREIGIPLVEGRDLFIEDDKVFMKTVSGPYPGSCDLPAVERRFPRSRGLQAGESAWRERPDARGEEGHGHARQRCRHRRGDDKAVYAYLPRIIRYYLDEEPILPIVETHICREPAALAYTLEHMDKLVVKPVGEFGGYGICVGPKATKAEIELAREQFKADPSNYISQPMIDLSVCPTLSERCRGAAACRPPAIRRHRQGHLASAGRPYARGLAQDSHHREFEPRRRHQRHLGLEGGRRREQPPFPLCRECLLDGALFRARGKPRTDHGNANLVPARARGQIPGRGSSHSIPTRSLSRSASRKQARTNVIRFYMAHADNAGLDPVANPGGARECAGA